MNENLWSTFCLNQILIYHHIYDIGIDCVETEEEIISEHENFENIDNNNSIIDEEIWEAPEASHQTIDSSRKRPSNTSRPGV